ncbi:hypothetical protein [Borreliella valaisiana]|uniref:hypothetical protein n=1 Tax=Borreliella valaisiana TaxID=62088 RepID=UPI00016B2E72|nr:hypothetical protein [Borreliella valaisiana]
MWNNFAILGNTFKYDFHQSLKPKVSINFTLKRPELKHKDHPYSRTVYNNLFSFFSVVYRFKNASMYNFICFLKLKILKIKSL